MREYAPYPGTGTIREDLSGDGIIRERDPSGGARRYPFVYSSKVANTSAIALFQAFLFFST